MQIRTKYIIAGMIFAVLIIIAATAFKSKKTDYQIIAAEKKDIRQEVSLTGNVKPAENVELSLETSGIVSKIVANAGDKIKKGQVILQLKSIDIAAQYKQAEANLDNAKAHLDEYKKGTRAEEIQIVETNYTYALQALEESKKNLQNIKNKADSDLKQAYSDALTDALYSISIAEKTLYDITTIQESQFYSYDQKSNNLADQKTIAVLKLLGQNSAGRWTNAALSSLSGGAKKYVLDANANPANENIDQALAETYGAAQAMKTMLNAVQIIPELTAAQITTINTSKTNIDTELISVDSKIQAIKSQKRTNDNNILTAEKALTTAQNNAASAEDQLNLKKAGYTKEQISAQSAQVKSAEANLLNYSAQMGKTILKSPIDGVVAEVNLKEGELATTTGIAARVISIAKFQIEANVPEVDITKIQIGSKAKVTLDAFSEDDIFETEVIKINPAEKIIENIPTYKVTLEFLDTNDLIKSGMTANIDILIKSKPDAIVIPNKAIFQKDGKKYVRKLDQNNKIIETEVETGIRGLAGEIEIVKGIYEGERMAMVAGVK